MRRVLKSRRLPHHEREEALRRVHPLYMLGSLKRFAFLLILPFLQGLLIEEGTVAERLYRFLGDALLVALVFLMAFAQWQRFRFGLHGDFLTVEKGVLFRRRAKLHTARIDFLSMEHTPMLSIMGAARVTLETAGGSRKHPDFSLLIGDGEAENIFESLSPPARREYVFRSHFLQMLFLAASWSNSAAGLLLAVPFVNQLGKIIGEDVARRIYDVATVGQMLLAIGMPPLIASVAWILLAGWAVAFLSKLFRHARFKAYRAEGFIVTQSGLISKRRHIARRSAVNGVTIQQSLPMVFLRMETVYLQVVGYGKKKGERALLAAGKSGNMRTVMERLAGYALSKNKWMMPLKSSKFGYVFPPSAALILVTLLFGAGLVFVPWLWDYLLIAWGFLSAFSLWRLVICLLGFSRAGLCFSDDTIELSTFKNLSLIRGILPWHRIQEIRIAQSCRQKKRGVCSVAVGLYSEEKGKIVVQGVSYQEVMDGLAEYAQDKLS